MPRRFERHKRGKGWWDSLPPRSGEVQQAAKADPEPAKRAPARKDTRHWCKGKEGREHGPVIEFRPWSVSDKDCRWASRWTYDGVKWHCLHAEVCSSCGKVLRDWGTLAATECPAYPGSDEQRVVAVAEAEESRERMAAWQVRRRPVITGPQGYRRQRQEQA
jgi:hypothetical protein